MANTKQLTIDELEPADVLLSHGHGLISDWIAKADGGKYSHGALWSGTGIIQATGAGIRHEPPEGEHDVYRYTGLDAATALEIVAKAKSQLDGKYAYAELVLLALLFTSGLRVKGAIASRMLDAIGGPRALKLKAWLDERAGRRTRVCTELVASCYFKVDNRKFAIRILPVEERPALEPPEAASAELPPLSSDGEPAVTRGSANGTTEPSADQLATARATCLELLLQSGWLQNEQVRGAGLVELEPLTTASGTGVRKVFAEAIAFDVSGKELGVVTPADLQFSPSLTFVGHFRT